MTVKIDPLLGLKLNLKKYGINHVEEKKTAMNVVLGHYDALEVKPVSKWLEFQPHQGFDVGEEARNSALSNQYPIKLIFPDPKCLPSKFQEGLKKINTWYRSDAPGPDAPCLTLTLANLTDAFKETCTEPYLAFLDQVAQECQAQLDELPMCCILPSIGYSDCCIMMADQSWQASMKLVDRLHSLSTEKGVPILSTDYMMPIFHKQLPSDELNANFFVGCTLSTRVNLKPGCTAEKLRKEINIPAVVVSRTSGGSDCELETDEPQCAASLLNRIFRHKDMFLDVTSTLHLMPQTCPEPCEKTSLPEPTVSFIDKFRKKIEVYGSHLKSKNRSMRQVITLRDLANSSENICRQAHSKRIRGIMERLLTDFSDCLERFTKCPDDSYATFVETEKSIERFCDIVEDFIMDLSRADSFFIERERYHHPSISSGTQLLLSYNEWLNQFTSDVRDATEQSGSSEHSFLVTSGGVDRTQTVDLFTMLEPEVDVKYEPHRLIEQKPLIVQMPELSLYDPSGTILRTIHECMHFCGSRMREERVDYINQFVARWLAQLLSVFLMEREAHLEYAEVCLKKINGTTTRTKELQELFDKSEAQFQNEVYEEILKALPKFDRNEEKTEYILRNYWEKLYSSLLPLFSGIKILATNDEKDAEAVHTNDFAQMLHRVLFDVHKAFYLGCNELVSKVCATALVPEPFPTAAFDIAVSMREAYRALEETDPLQETKIQLVLARFLMTEGIRLGTKSEKRNANESEDEWNRRRQEEQKAEGKYWEKNFPYFRVVDYNLPFVLNVVEDVFSETFSDYMACRLLGANVVDYLLMHLYEDNDLEYSLDDDINYALRISSVLRWCYADDLNDTQSGLSDAAKTRLDLAIAQLRLHNCQDIRTNLNAYKINERLGEMLHTYQESEQMLEPLKAYLEGCWDRRYKMLNQGVGIIKPYHDAFQKLRLYEKRTDDPAQIWEMYHALRDEWRKRHGTS